jgi:peptidoglycan/LPS O-acetylase OafA/YrhL
LTKVGDPKTTGRSSEIDGLRAISALIVVFAHAGFVPGSGATGVTFFFVISGYVITLTLLSEFKFSSGFSIGKFLLRRFFKLFPPLLGIVILPSILFYKVLSLNTQGLMSQLFFYFNWVDIQIPDLQILPGSGVVWSLSVEEQFYISIAIFWLIIIKMAANHAVKLLTYFYVLIYVYSTLCRFYIHFSDSASRDGYNEILRIMRGTDSRMSAIALGGLLAIFVSQFMNKPRPSLSIFYNWQFVLTCSFFLLILSHNRDFLIMIDVLHFSLGELSVGLVIMHLAIRDKKVNFSLFNLLNLKLLQVIGLCSYSIYLSHMIFILALEAVGIFSIGILKIEWIGSISKIILSVIIGIICHKLFDAPFESRRARYRTSRPD